MKIKIKDIAYLAGVSPATVSLALNNKGRISNSTRQRILDVATQYAYISEENRNENSSQRNSTELNSAVTHTDIKTLAILSHHTFPSYSSGIKKQFFHELCDAIQEEAMRAGYRTSVSLLENSEYERVNPDAFDGFIIFASTLSSQELERLVEPLLMAHKPFVICDKYFNDLPFDFVVSDNWYGGYLAGSYIAAQGYKNVGYFRCDVRLDNLEKRHLGFVAALREAGLQLDPQNVYTLSADSQKCHREIMDLVASGRKFPQAVFAETDYLAIDTIQALTSCGISVPEDVSIIGFDNIHSSSLVHPALTTIGVHKGAMANTIISRINVKIRDPQNPPQKIITSVHIVERDSFRKNVL